VARRRGMPAHALAGARMQQRKLGRMQRLAAECEAMARAAPVDRVADQRMPDVLEMHADLVRAPGLEPALDQRRAPEALEYPVRRARGLAARAHRHAGAGADVARDRG